MDAARAAWLALVCFCATALATAQAPPASPPGTPPSPEVAAAAAPDASAPDAAAPDTAGSPTAAAPDAATSPDAQKPASAPFKTQVYRGPEIVELPKEDIWPKELRGKEGEGWADLSLMIDPAGKPHEIAVIESSGHPGIDKAAIDFASRVTYKPATHEGQPVDAAFKFKMKFSRRSEPSRKFLKTFESLDAATRTQDRARVEELLTKLKPTNLAEQSYESIARYYYARTWGTDEEERAHLRRAVAGETKPGVLPEPMFVGVLYSQFNLQVKTEDFGGALKSWEMLKPYAPQDMRDKLQGTVDQIEALRKTDRPVRLAAQVGSGASWFGQLFKDRFRIAVTSGRVAEIKLRCQKQYVFFRHREGAAYKIDPGSGTCGIEVTGDPGTRFELIQS